MKRREFIGVAAASLAWPFWRSVSASASPSADGGAAATLARSIDGKVFVPGCAEYALKRHGFAAGVDLHPAMVVQVTSARDVSTTVQFARRRRLPLAVRCGGHSYAGYNSCDGGIAIDLSALAIDGKEIDVMRANMDNLRRDLLGPKAGLKGSLPVIKTVPNASREPCRFHSRCHARGADASPRWERRTGQERERTTSRAGRADRARPAGG